MITLLHFVKLAVHNLRRGGARVFVALLCITFGITALVAMTLLASALESTILLAPNQVIGGDLSLVRSVEDTLSPENIAQLQTLQQTGEIGRYLLIAFNNQSLMFHTSASGEMHFAGNGMGIEPEKYPLAGSLSIGEPSAASLPTLLQGVGDLVITRDIARQYNLKVGDPLVLSDVHYGTPLQGVVRGIAYDTPNHQGDKIYYTLATAQALANGLPAVNTVIANTTRGAELSTALENSGWTVDWVTGRETSAIANLWLIGLRAAGILGLLVGGIGIANTMQVLLRRRQREIAIWKTLGYRQGHLTLIFTLEAGLLGLTGSVLGAGLGILLSSSMFELLMRTSTVLYAWAFSPIPPLVGILAGTLSTLIFAYWAIALSGQASPASLLRSEALTVRRIPGCQSAVLVLLLALPFTILTSLVMKSAGAGVGVLVSMAVGIALIGGFFSILLWLVTHLLHLPRFPLVRMAFKSLQRRGAGLIFAMIALFIGVFSMSLGLMVVEKSTPSGLPQAGDPQGYNLDILAAPAQESTIRQAVEGQNPQKVGVGYYTALASFSLPGGQALEGTDASLVGRSDPQDYILSGAAWGTRPEGVYVPQWANLAPGSQVRAVLRDGNTRTFTVAGSYTVNYDSLSLYPPGGLLLDGETFKQVATPDALSYFVRVDPNQVGRAAKALAAGLPQATVVDLVAYAGRFMVSYRKLFALPMVMAGMALLAGLLLVANAVSLAMLDRRYEIGVLKTLGYTRRQVLFIFEVEYGLAGLLATVSGVLVIEGLLAGLAFANHLPITVLLLSFPSLGVLVLCGIGLTLLTVLSVTWGPGSVAPSAILNQQNG